MMPGTPEKAALLAALLPGMPERAALLAALLPGTPERAALLAALLVSPGMPEKAVLGAAWMAKALAANWTRGRVPLAARAAPLTRGSCTRGARPPPPLLLNLPDFALACTSRSCMPFYLYLKSMSNSDLPLWLQRGPWKPQWRKAAADAPVVL